MLYTYTSNHTSVNTQICLKFDPSFGKIIVNMSFLILKWVKLSNKCFKKGAEGLCIFLNAWLNEKQGLHWFLFFVCVFVLVKLLWLLVFYYLNEKENLLLPYIGAGRPTIIRHYKRQMETLYTVAIKSVWRDLQWTVLRVLTFCMFKLEAFLGQSEIRV